MELRLIMVSSLCLIVASGLQAADDSSVTISAPISRARRTTAPERAVAVASDRVNDRVVSYILAAANLVSAVSGPIFIIQGALQSFDFADAISAAGRAGSAKAVKVALEAADRACAACEDTTIDRETLVAIFSEFAAAIDATRVIALTASTHANIAANLARASNRVSVAIALLGNGSDVESVG